MKIMKMRLSNLKAKKIVNYIRKNGGKIGGIYFPPEEAPLSNEDIENSIKKFRCAYPDLTSYKSNTNIQIDA
jgi:hypothetical protein